MPFRDLLREALAQVGFVIARENEFSYWIVTSHAREINRESAVWHVAMYAQPELGDGVILFTRNFISLGGKRVEYAGFVALSEVFPINSAAALAKDFAEGAADALLSGAHRRCQDMNVTLLEEEAQLERMRDQLTEEIIRVRERRAEQEKRLKLQVEQ